jgi:hypothetical protein
MDITRLYAEELTGAKPPRPDTEEEAEARERIRRELKDARGVVDLPFDWSDDD